MLLSAITMVKNEEEFVGYAILSMIDYIDQLIVVDGGSTDGTVDIINNIRQHHDPDNKITYWEDHRPKNQLICTRNDMVNACKGDWILRLEGDEVYTNHNAQKVRRLLKSRKLSHTILSAGWPYYFFVNDIKTIVPIGQNHTFATIIIRNNCGIRAAHHDKGGNETFYDEGWFDKDGKNISIWHPNDNPTRKIKSIGIHHYAGFKASTRHHNYILTCNKIPFKEGHPEVFLTHDLKPLMHNNASRDIISHIEQHVHSRGRKTVKERIRKLFKGY